MMSNENEVDIAVTAAIEEISRKLSHRPRFWKFRRAIKFWWQRRTRGWDDSQTWNLDSRIAEFVLPRLRRFKELNDAHPHDSTEEGWDAEIDEMIYGLEACACESFSDEWDQIDWDRAHAGLALFGKRFRDLWR